MTFPPWVNRAIRQALPKGGYFQIRYNSHDGHTLYINGKRIKKRDVYKIAETTDGEVRVRRKK